MFFDPDFVFSCQYIDQSSFTEIPFVKHEVLDYWTENYSAKIKCQSGDEFSAWITFTFTSSHWYMSPPIAPSNFLWQPIWIYQIKHENVSSFKWKLEIRIFCVRHSTVWACVLHFNWVRDHNIRGIIIKISVEWFRFTNARARSHCAERPHSVLMILKRLSHQLNSKRKKIAYKWITAYLTES